MELIRGLHNIRPRHRGCVTTIGAFDDVHHGHRAVLQQLIEKGRELNLPTTVVVFEPLPRSLEWDNESVDFIMQSSAVLLTPPALSASISNPFRAVGAFRQYKRAQKLPKGRRLEAVLTKEQWARYQRIADAYDVSEQPRLRPLFAAQKLQTAALKRVGLEDAERVKKAIHRLAKRHDLAELDAQVELELKFALRMLESIEAKADSACFDLILEYFGSDDLATCPFIRGVIFHLWGKKMRFSR